MESAPGLGVVGLFVETLEDQYTLSFPGSSLNFLFCMVTTKGRQFGDEYIMIVRIKYYIHTITTDSLH